MQVVHLNANARHESKAIDSPGKCTASESNANAQHLKQMQMHLDKMQSNAKMQMYFMIFLRSAIDIMLNYLVTIINNKKLINSKMMGVSLIGI